MTGLEKAASVMSDRVWQVAFYVMTAVCGFLAAIPIQTGGMTNDIAALKEENARQAARIAKIESRLGARTDFMICNTRNMDKIFDRLGETPACPLQVPE